MKVLKTPLPSEEEFLLLLHDRAFVDYLSVFLALPIFGQRILYQFHADNFIFDPPIKEKKGTCHQDRVAEFIRTERYPLFRNTRLYLEYQLCTQLRNSEDKIMLWIGEEQLDNSKSCQLLEFFIGHVIGMQNFRQSLLGTPGHDAYCCWVDLQKFWNLPEDERPEREQQFRHIRATYLMNGAPKQLSNDKIIIAVTNMFSTEALPKDLRHDLISEEKYTHDAVIDAMFSFSNPECFKALQNALHFSLKYYWLPRYVNHLLKTTPCAVMQKALQKDWTLEGDGLELRVKIMFQRLFPRQELDFTPPLESIIVDDQGEDKWKRKLYEQNLDIYRSDPCNSLTLSSENLPKTGEGLKRLSTTAESTPGQEIYASGVISDTESRAFGASLWTPTSTGIDTLDQPPTGYSVYSQTFDDDTTEESNSSSLDFSAKFMQAKRATRSRTRFTNLGNVRHRRNFVSNPLEKLMELTSQLPNDFLNRLLCFYIHGRARQELSCYERTHRRFVLAMASSTMAGCPFKEFLTEEDYQQSVDNLDFWDNIKEFLTTDHNMVDGNWQNAKSAIATKITERYLLESRTSNLPLKASFRQTVYQALLYDNQPATLCAAQDIVVKHLHQSWKEYRSSDRRLFLRFTCWKPNQVCIQRKRRKLERCTVLRNAELYDLGYDLDLYDNKLESGATGATSPSTAQEQPTVISYAQQQLSAGKFSEEQPQWPSTTEEKFEAIQENDEEAEATIAESNDSQLQDQLSTDEDIKENERKDEPADKLAWYQSKRAFELAVAIIHPEAALNDYTIDDFFTILEGNYGSLLELKEKRRSQRHLRMLTKQTIWNVATLNVDRISLYERPIIPDGVTMDKNNLVLRANGAVIPCPPKPRSFKDVMSDPAHLDYFRRFLTVKNTQFPLQFWMAVQDIKSTRCARLRRNKIVYVTRRFFPKFGKSVKLLDLSEDIIRQIRVMDRNSAAVLFCAQRVVYRLLERKWYSEYLELFPAGEVVEDRISESPRLHLSPTFFDLYQKPSIFSGVDGSDSRKVKPRIQIMWTRLVTLLTRFSKATKHPLKMKLFDMFLRLQLRREIQRRGLASDANNEYAETEYKTMMLTKVIVINKLPRDLAFWIEMRRFTELEDELRGRADRITVLENTDIESLRKKMVAIIDCFLASDVPPRVQINISNDMAHNVITTMQINGPGRPIFHELAINLFTVLFQYWRECETEWHIHRLAECKLENLYETITTELYGNENRSLHECVSIPNYMNLTPDDYQSAVGYVEDNQYRLNFSLLHGVRVIQPITMQTHKMTSFMRANGTSRQNMSRLGGMSRTSISNIASVPVKGRHSQISGKISSLFRRESEAIIANTSITTETAVQGYSPVKKRVLPTIEIMRPA